MKLYYRVERFDKNNGLISRGRKRESKSFVCAFLQVLYTTFANLSYSIKDISNTVQTQSASVSGPLFLRGNSYPTTYVTAYYQYNETNATISVAPSEYVGIVIGTGNTAVTPTDYKLVTRIAHGTTSGKMEYSGTMIYPVVVSAPNASFDIERIFRNSSGGSIEIKELGIDSHTLNGANGAIYCIIRDVLSPTVTVNDGEYLKVTYTFQITA